MASPTSFRPPRPRPPRPQPPRPRPPSPQPPRPRPPSPQPQSEQGPPPPWPVPPKKRRHVDPSSRTNAIGIKCRPADVLKEENRSELVALLSQFPGAGKSAENQQVKEVYSNLVRNELRSFSFSVASLLRSSGDEVRTDALGCLSELAQRWHGLTAADLKEVKGIILDCLKNQASSEFLAKLCRFVKEIVSADAKKGPPGNEWPDLFDFLIQSDDPNLLGLLSELIQCYGPKIRTAVVNIDSLHDKLSGTLNSKEVGIEVKVAAIRATVDFIVHWDVPSHQDKYHLLVADVVKNIAPLTNVSRATYAKMGLEKLVELAKEKAVFLASQLFAVFEYIFKIIDNAALNIETDFMGLEFALALAEDKEHGHKMMLRSPDLVGNLFKRLVTMLQYRDDGGIVENEVEDQDRQSMVYSWGSSSLKRLADAFGGQICQQSLPGTMFTAQNWQTRFAVVTYVAIMAETSPNFVKWNLGLMAPRIFKVIQEDMEPRVRWAALCALEELSKHLSPSCQEKYPHEVLSALIRAMDDSDNPGIQAQAVSAMIPFTATCTPNVLKPYFNDIMTKLLEYLEEGKQMLKVKALKALASFFAEAEKDHFQKYYDTVMRYLKVLMISANKEKNKTLLAEWLNCTTMLWMKAGKEKIIMNDIDLVVELLILWQVSELSAGDPMRAAVVQAWGRICKCLGQEFRPYMTSAVPFLLTCAGNLSYSKDSAGEVDESMWSTTTGATTFSVDTKVLEEKAAACYMLCWCASEMKESFHPWILRVAKTLVSVLNFKFCSNVRRAAIECLPFILRSCKAAVENGLLKWDPKSPFNNESPLEKLCFIVLPALLDALKTETLDDLRSKLLETLQEYMETSGHVLTQGKMKLLWDGMMRVLRSCSSPLPVEDEKEREVCNKVVDCLVKFMKTKEYTFQSFFEQFLPYTSQMWDKDKTANEREIGFRIFCVVAEQEEAFRIIGTIIPSLLEAIHDEDREVKKVAAKAIGVCAQRGGSVFGSHVGDAVSGLIALMEQTLSGSLIHDYAVSSLGKVILFHGHRNDGFEFKVFKTWVSHLPIRNNAEEAKDAHNELCSVVEKFHAGLLDPRNGIIQLVIGVYAEIIHAGDKLATQHTVSKMTAQMKDIKTRLPALTWTSILSSMQPDLGSWMAASF